MKQRVSELKGEEKALMKQLKDLGFKTIEDADKHLDTLEQELDTLAVQIQEAEAKIKPYLQG